MKKCRRLSSISALCFLWHSLTSVSPAFSAAVAAQLMIAGPVGQETWGKNLNQPIAPNELRYADKIFQSDLKGQQWLSAYVADILASLPNLNAARAHRWYALPSLNDLVNEHGLRPAPTSASTLQSFEDKQSRDMPALLVELDQRFATLTRLADEATQITLPPESFTGTVAYCSWIKDATTAPSTLSRTLYSRCLQDRDAYLNQLIRHLAELQPLPTLPAPDPLPRYRLSRAVIPADLSAPGFDFQGGEQLFHKIYEERLAANYSVLAENLQRAIEQLDVSNRIRPPDVECRTILGGYGSLRKLSEECQTAVASRTVDRLVRVKAAASAELRAALQDARDNPAIPAALDSGAGCRKLLGQFFEFEDPYVAWSPLLGLTSEQSDDLLTTCRTGVIAVNQVTDQRRAEAKATAERAIAQILDQIMAAGLSQLPASDNSKAWRAAKWFPRAPRNGLTTDEVSSINNAGWQNYEARWQIVSAIPRKTAAMRLIGLIDNAFAVAKTSESLEITALCAGQARSTGEIMLDQTLGTQMDPNLIRNEMSTFRSGPGLDAAQASSWVAAACRMGYQQLAARRMASAEEKAGTNKVFVAGMPIWVRTVDGELQRFDPAELVRDAAVDGIQVAYKPKQWWQWWQSHQVIVTPIGRDEPRLSGKLLEVARADGVNGLEVVGLSSLPGLDGPAETMNCLALPAERSGQEGMWGLAAGIAMGAVFDTPFVGSRVARRGLDQAMAAKACFDAKCRSEDILSRLSQL